MPGMPTVMTDVAVELMRKFIVTEDLNTPAGAVTLRGAWNFKTPSGWDTVYSPVFNALERPIPPMMVVRVEKRTGYAHESEFPLRYVLQPGETNFRRAQYADRAGFLRSARTDHASRVDRVRKSPRIQRVAGRLFRGEGTPTHDLLWVARLAPITFAKAVRRTQPTRVRAEKRPHRK